MKGNSPLFKNKGNKTRSLSNYSINNGKVVDLKPYNNKKGIKMLQKVKASETKNYIVQNYRNNGKVGDGSTIDAVKKELKTGVKIGGKSHITKAKQEIQRIEKILNKNPNHVDKKFLANEKRKLEKALKTKSNKGGKKNGK